MKAVPIVAIICGSLLLSAAGVSDSAAHISAAKSSTESIKGQDGATAYAAGIGLVYRDRRLETAIQNLSTAVRLEPQKGEYRLALGCALVRRAHVLRDASTRAILFEKEKASYPERYATWERAQSDQKSALYGTSAPSSPIPPTTRDDDRPFTLTPAQAKERANDLCKKALAEWDAALSLAPTDAARANTQFVRGWGMFVIKRIGMAFEQNPPGSSTFGQYVPWLDKTLVPDQEQIAEAFQAALAIAPNNAQYWQSLGDAYVSDVSPQLWSRDKAIAAYEKALKIDRRSALLWYQIYTIQQQRDLVSAAVAIQKAANTDSSNAFFWYLLANVELKRYAGTGTGTDKGAEKSLTSSPDSAGAPDPSNSKLAMGLDALQKGNGATFRPATYPYAIPKILAPLFANDPVRVYAEVVNGEFMMTIPQNVGVAVKAFLARGDYDSSVAAARATVGFSEKMLAFTDVQANPYLDLLASVTSGTGIVSSYSSLIKALEAAGNAEATAEARMKMQTLDATVRKRMRGIEENYTLSTK